MSLSAQAKLALALTSAGSQRELGRRLGISHQKVGRWLREGLTVERIDDESGEIVDVRIGVFKIPSDFFTQAAIDTIYNDHVSEARKHARRDKIPFSSDAPVYATRKPLRKTTLEGAPIMGDRVFVEHTQHIRKDLREKVIYAAVRSGKFHNMSVRSTIDLHKYNEQARQREKTAAYKRAGAETKRKRKRAKKQFKFVENFGIKVRPVYTKHEDISKHAEPWRAAENINAKLRQRHEPATGATGTAFADQYLFQLKPANYDDVKKQAKVSTSGVRRSRAAPQRGKPRAKKA